MSDSMQEAQTYSLSDLIGLMWSSWRYVTPGLVLGGGIALTVSLAWTPVYRAEVVSTPVSANSAGPLARLGGQLGGLAALAGVSTGASGDKAEAVAILESVSFSMETIERWRLMPVMFSGKWDEKLGRWKDADESKWPTIQDGWKRFDTTVRYIIEDRERGLVTLRIELPDADLAAKVANEMISRLNAETRARRVAELDRSIGYLNSELAKSTVVEARQAIARVLEVQVNDRMLAGAQQDFSLRVVDPAIVPDADKFVRPKAALWTAMGVVLGAILGFLVFLIRAASVGSRRGRA